MNKPKSHIIKFAMEPADRSVGIMSEGFSAWTTDGDCWCNLDDMGTTRRESKFTWFSNESGDVVDRPDYAAIVECTLLAYAEGVYETKEEEICARKRT